MVKGNVVLDGSVFEDYDIESFPEFRRHYKVIPLSELVEERKNLKLHKQYQGYSFNSILKKYPFLKNNGVYCFYLRRENSLIDKHLYGGKASEYSFYERLVENDNHSHCYCMEYVKENGKINSSNIIVEDRYKFFNKFINNIYVVFYIDIPNKTLIELFEKFNIITSDSIFNWEYKKDVKLIDLNELKMLIIEELKNSKKIMIVLIKQTFLKTV